MHGFPADLDLNILIGATLDQIGLGSYHLNFNFSSDNRIGVTIGVEGKLRVTLNNTEIASWNEVWSSIEFQKLLNGIVEGYKVISKELLIIKFAGGLALELYDESEQYESITISFGGPDKTFIVI